MGVFDYCAAGHWDEEGVHDCTHLTGFLEDMQEFQFVVIDSKNVEKHNVLWFNSEQYVDENYYDVVKFKAADNLFEMETGVYVYRLPDGEVMYS